jgi:hypothetical protein
LALNKIVSQCSQAIVLAVCPAIFDGHILTVNVSRFFQTLKEGTERGREALGRSTVKKSDHRQRMLLRKRRERPRRCAAQKRDELAPPHSMTSSAIAITPREWF